MAVGKFKDLKTKRGVLFIMKENVICLGLQQHRNMSTHPHHMRDRISVYHGPVDEATVRHFVKQVDADQNPS